MNISLKGNLFLSPPKINILSLNTKAECPSLGAGITPYLTVSDFFVRSILFNCLRNY